MASLGLAFETMGLVARSHKGTSIKKGHVLAIKCNEYIRKHINNIVVYVLIGRNVCGGFT